MPADHGDIDESVRSWYTEQGLQLNEKNVSTCPEDQELLASWHGLLIRKAKLPVGVGEQVVSLDQQMLITSVRSWYDEAGRNLTQGIKGAETLARQWQRLKKKPCEEVRVLVSELEEETSESSWM